MDDKNFINTIISAQTGDEKSIIKLLDKFKPLLYKHSIINGKFNEDCFQELLIKLINCIKTFNLDFYDIEIIKSN